MLFISSDGMNLVNMNDTKKEARNEKRTNRVKIRAGKISTEKTI